MTYCLKKIKLKSEYDGMTGVYNRGKFDEEFEEGRKKWKSIGIIVIDIDNFKKLNDTYGHSFGDKVLKENSFLMNEYCKKNRGVKVYRYGGEEFVILIKNRSKKEIYEMADENLYISKKNGKNRVTFKM